MIISTKCTHPIVVTLSTVKLAYILEISETEKKGVSNVESNSEYLDARCNSREFLSVIISRVSQEKQQKMGELLQMTLDYDIVETTTIDDAKLED